MSIRVLVVEDEALLAIDIAEYLTDAGFAVVGPATSVAKALSLIGEGGCDVAVLDFNLRDETAEAIAYELRARGTPFIFLSGVSPERLPASFEHTLLLPKPAHPAALVAALKQSVHAVPDA
jgi:DNA-binding response OmpR family regulator